MHRALLVLLALALVLVALPPLVSASPADVPSASPATAPQVTFSPTSGGKDDTYTIEGTGFPAGAILVMAMAGPDGTTYSAWASGRPWAIVADSDGYWSEDVTPSSDFYAPYKGVWTFAVALTDSNDVWKGTITVTDN